MNPDIAKQMLIDLFTSYGRHALTALGGFLVTHGLATQDQAGQLIQLGLGALAWGINLILIWLSHKKAAWLLQAAKDVPPGVSLDQVKADAVRLQVGDAGVPIIKS